MITHKDRLLRFGAELIFALCEAREVEVVMINSGTEGNFEEELVKDVLEIITVFSARLYGSRSRKNQKFIRRDEGYSERCCGRIKVELKINNKQATYFAKASGVARKTFSTRS